MDKADLIQFLKDNLSATVSIENESYRDYYDEATSINFRVRVSLLLEVDGEKIILSEDSACL